MKVTETEGGRASLPSDTVLVCLESDFFKDIYIYTYIIFFYVDHFKSLN